ncbi:MAG TPA: hypothetical protein VHX86_10615 [Tepidisphaeraceae bacterium]|nr:hypothetical protein [Tepidisphaeraceae bacterium]
MTGKADLPDHITPQKQRAIESMFDGLPVAVNERYRALQDIRKAFYVELAKRFEPTLNEFARAQPQVTDEDWSELATSVNRMARHLGLALVSPRNNAPAMLAFDTKRSGDRVIRRYRLNAIGRRTAPYTCYELPDLELCQAPVRIEPLSQGFRETGRDDGPVL